MKPISEFSPAFGTAILLIGPMGSGKTTLAARLFPKTYVCVTDQNLQSALTYLRKIKEDGNIIGFDTPAIGPDGKPLLANAIYDAMWKALTDASIDPTVETMVNDSLTFIEQIIKAKICGALKEENIKIEGYGQWTNVVMCWRALISGLRKSGKRQIFICHDQMEKDEQGICRFGPALDGRIANLLGCLVSDVWRCEVEEKLGKHTWMVRTLGNTSHALKNTFGLPAYLPQDELVKLVRATLTK